MSDLFSLDLFSKVQPETIRRLKIIAGHYPSQEAFVQYMIDYGINNLKRSNFEMRLDLQKYEERYNMTSETFYTKFINGEVDDREDFMIWSGLYEFILENEAKLKELT